MLFLLRYAFDNDESCVCESHTLLKDHKMPFKTLHVPSLGDPYEIIETTFDAINIIIENAVMTVSVSFLLNNGKLEDLHSVHNYHSHNNELFEYFKNGLVNKHQKNARINTEEKCQVKKSDEFFFHKIEKGYLDLNSSLRLNITESGSQKKGYNCLNDDWEIKNYTETDNKYTVNELDCNLKRFLDSFVPVKRIIKSFLYKTESTHESIVNDFYYLCDKVDSGGTVIEIHVAKHNYISIAYKKTRRNIFLRNSVPTLKFIGRTSMEVSITYFTTNLCDVRAGMVVLDPCAGSGSLLTASASKNAYILAGDIDIKEMVGYLVSDRVKTKLKGRQIKDNFDSRLFLGAVQVDCGKCFKGNDDYLQNLKNNEGMKNPSMQRTIKTR